MFLVDVMVMEQNFPSWPFKSEISSNSQSLKNASSIPSSRFLMLVDVQTYSTDFATT